MTTLRPALAPFGAWVVDERACTLWVPDTSLVGDDFAPYLSDGHWTYADDGYEWVGDYAWSDTTFHYGRWIWTETWGWAWVPGALYAPSWVEWRYGEGWIGWGPTQPGFCWQDGRSLALDEAPTDFVFAPAPTFFSAHPADIVVEGPALIARTTSYARPSRPAVGRRGFVGPDPRDVGLSPDQLTSARGPERRQGAKPAPVPPAAPRPTRESSRGYATPSRAARSPVFLTATSITLPGESYTDPPAVLAPNATPTTPTSSNGLTTQLGGGVTLGASSPGFGGHSVAGAGPSSGAAAHGTTAGGSSRGGGGGRGSRGGGGGGGGRGGGCGHGR
jgi:hypothetical protein